MWIKFIEGFVHGVGWGFGLTVSLGVLAALGWIGGGQ